MLIHSLTPSHKYTQIHTLGVLVQNIAPESNSLDQGQSIIDMDHHTSEIPILGFESKTRQTVVLV